MVELEKYNSELLDKDRLLVITKSDLIDDELKQEISSMINMKHIFISSITNDGLDNLKDSIWQLLNDKDD